MSSIEAFRSSINKYTDFARNSRFLVRIPWGGNSALGAGGTEETLTFRCEEAELPGRTFSTFEARTYGPFQKYPALTSYNEINLTFLCSGNKSGGGLSGGEKNTGFIEKRIIENWMETVQVTPNSTRTTERNQSNWNFRYKNSYVKTITILHFDVVGEADRGTARREPGPASSVSSKNQVTYGVDLIRAFPTSMNQIALSWGNDDISRLVVTFAYEYWQTLDSAASYATEPNVELQPPQTVSTQIPRNNEPSSTGSLEANRAELRRLSERAEARNAQTQAPGEGPR